MIELRCATFTRETHAKSSRFAKTYTTWYCEKTLRYDRRER